MYIIPNPSTQAQLEFTHFSKPKARFVRETTYGIQASGDTKLSSVVRAIDDDVEPIQTEKRLSRNIEDEHLGDAVAQAILAEGANLVKAEILSCASSPAASCYGGGFTKSGSLRRTAPRDTGIM